jgi:hypothetical protein
MTSSKAIMLRVDVRPLQERIAFARRRIPGARAEALRSAVRTGLRAVLAVSPRDTLRYSRAWAMAGNQAGVGPFAVPSVQRSRFAEQWADRLAVQTIEQWQRLKRARLLLDSNERALRNAEAAIANGRRGKEMRLRLIELRRTNAKLRRWEKEAEEKWKQSKEELDLYAASGGQAVVIFGKRRTKTGRQRLTTVRPKIYGGSGREHHTPEASRIDVRNLEPHARIVEFKKRLAAKAMGLLRQMGITTGRAALLGSMNSGPRGGRR